MGLGSLVRRLVAGSAPSDPTGTRGPGGSRTAGSAGSARLASPGAGPSAPTNAWRSLPAIQRSSGPAPLVAPNAPFEARLASTQPAPVALARLGHDRGLSAPAGLMSGLAAPVQRAPSEPVPSSVRRPAALQRARAHGSRSAGAGATWPSMPDDAGASVDLPEDSSAPAIDAGATAPGGASPVVVARAIVGLSLVEAPSVPATPTGLIGTPAVARAGAVQRSAAEPGHADAHGHTLTEAAVEAAVSRAPAEAPALSRSFGDPAAVDRSGSQPAAPATPTPPIPTVARSSLGRPRRVRFGSALADGMTVSRAAAGAPDLGGAEALAGDEAGPAAIVAAGLGGDEDGGPGVGAAPGAGAPGAPSPASMDDAASVIGSLGVARSAADPAALDPEAGQGPAPVVARSAATPGPVPLRLPTVSRMAAAPLVGRLRPTFVANNPSVAVRPSVIAQRDAMPVDDGSPTAALAALARVDPFGSAGRVPGTGFGGAGQPAGSPWGAGGLGGASFGDQTESSEPAVARSAMELRPSESRLTWANPWFKGDTGPATAASQANGIDGFGVGGFDAGTASPRAGLAAVTRDAGGGVRRGGATGAAAGAGPSPVGPFVPRPRTSRIGPAIQRSSGGDGGWASFPDAPAAVSGSSSSRSHAASAPDAAETGASADDSTVERSADALPALAPMVIQREGDASPPAAARGGGDAGGAAGATGAAGSEQQLDDLARKLYDKIGLRLRRELLVERERAGVLIDRGF